jgi:hypothetical protein
MSIGGACAFAGARTGCTPPAQNPGCHNVTRVGPAVAWGLPTASWSCRAARPWSGAVEGGEVAHRGDDDEAPRLGGGQAALHGRWLALRLQGVSSCLPHRERPRQHCHREPLPPHGRGAAGRRERLSDARVSSSVCCPPSPSPWQDLGGARLTPGSSSSEDAETASVHFYCSTSTRCPPPAGTGCRWIPSVADHRELASSRILVTFF